MWATGLGPMPGDDAAAYGEAVRTVLGELGAPPGLPFLPDLTARGVGAAAPGRTLAIVTDLGADLQPAGWRLTDAPGVDHRRARSLMAQDLDQIEEQAQGYAGPFKIQITGPWTLAATVERPRGDKVLADHGARRELGQALAEGIAVHVRDVRRRMGGVDRLIVQVDEPLLAAVLDAKVPTASGFGRHRSVDLPEAAGALQEVLAAAAAAGGEPWVGVGAGVGAGSGRPLGLVRGAGARGLIAPPGTLSAADLDDLAEMLEYGGVVVWPLEDTSERPGQDLLRWLDMVGLDAGEVGERVVVTWAEADGEKQQTSSRQSLGRIVETARRLDGG